MSSAHANVHCLVHINFHVHVYSVRIPPGMQKPLYEFITEVVEHPKRRHKLIEIGGVDDHVHILVDMHPGQSIAEIVRDIKSNSGRFIRQHPDGAPQFQWQTGYAAMSVCRRCHPPVAAYIQRQAIHHKKN